MFTLGYFTFCCLHLDSLKMYKYLEICCCVCYHITPLAARHLYAVVVAVVVFIFRFMGHLPCILFCLLAHMSRRLTR